MSEKDEKQFADGRPAYTFTNIERTGKEIGSPDAAGGRIGFTSPETVGHYDLGAVFLRVTKRPSWFQRVMVRWCFGWKWKNK